MLKIANDQKRISEEIRLFLPNVWMRLDLSDISRLNSKFFRYRVYADGGDVDVLDGEVNIFLVLDNNGLISSIVKCLHAACR